MKKSVLFTLIFLVLVVKLEAQRLYGTVFNERGDLLPFSSITVKGTSIGASANNMARYSFNLSPGKYTLVCQHIGYATQEKQVELNGETELTFILKEQKLVMKEVVVKSGAEDPAYEIIRQAIKKRPYYNGQVNGFICDMYGKDLIKLRNMPDKIFGQKIEKEDKSDMGLDSTGKGIVYLSESVSKIYSQKPDKFKMEVISSRVSGSNSFGFAFPAFISLYTNNVKLFTERLNPRGFVSPIADGAIRYYKFKFLGTFWEDGKAVNSIRVTPRRQYEPLFSGVINITDEDWRIQSFDLTLTKTSQLELIDTLRITQLHVPVGNDVWRVKNQLIYFNFNMFKIDAIGNFLTVYSNYQVNPLFNNRIFNNIVIKYDTAVNKRPKNYWDSIRPVPLEMEELNDYKVKDSLFENRKDTLRYSGRQWDSLNRKRYKLTPKKILLSGYEKRRMSPKRSLTWGIDPLIWNMAYNNPEGVVLNLNGYVQQSRWKGKTQVSFEPNIRYGFSNGHLNAWASLAIRKRVLNEQEQLQRQTLRFSGGKRVSEFNNESPLSPLINSISILFYGKNYIKTYENYFGSVRFSKRYENGFRFSIDALYEDRRPIENTTWYTFRKSDTIHITPNYPNERIPAQFTRHQATIISADLSFRPGQKYIQLPHSKIPMGSKYPTFSLRYSKGINKLLGSDADFDKWQFTVKDDRNLKLAGTLRYKLGVGGFLNRRQVFIQDYQHFNGNRTTAASEYLNSFQLADYYGNSTTASFYALGHLEYHFNGLLTNKIPLFRKLNWNLVGGSNTFYVNQNNHYVEAFAGLENILKLFRIDFVAGYLNGAQGRTGIRIGAGGVLGSGISTEPGSRGRSMRISF